MNNEHLNAVSAGPERVEPLPYHSPKFVSLGTMQALVQAAMGPGPDGGTTDVTSSDGTGSGPPI